MLAPLGRAAKPLLDSLSPKALRAAVYRTDPSLARIIDREDPDWVVTRSYHGTTGLVYESYGLCQSDPGTKMSVEGPGWQTSATLQLRWCVAYADSRYGSTSNAWAAWQRQGWW